MPFVPGIPGDGNEAADEEAHRVQRGQPHAAAFGAEEGPVEHQESTSPADDDDDRADSAGDLRRVPLAALSVRLPEILRCVYQAALREAKTGPKPNDTWTICCCFKTEF